MRSDEVKGILQSIYDDRGSLTPELVVDEARVSSHPLHSYFEWDDSVAGEQFRRLQAAGLIRSVKVVYAVDEEGKNKTTRAFVSVRPPDQPTRVYRPTEEVVVDPVQYAILLNDLRKDWLRFQARWQHVQEFAEIVRSELPGEGQQQTG